MQNTYKFHLTTHALPEIEQLLLKYPKKYQPHYFDLYLYVMDYVLRNSSKTQNSVPINRNLLSKTLGCNNKKTSVIISDLVMTGCIEPVKFSRFGLNSTHFGIPESHETIFVVEHIKESKTAKKIIATRNKSFEQYLSTVEGQLYYSYISNIQLNSISDSIDTLSSIYLSPIGVDLILTKAEKQYSNLLRIHHKDLFVKRPDPNSRVICNFSILHRELRKHLVIEGKTLKCIDIRNSQPLLAGVYIKQSLIREGKEVPQELDHYISRCEQGQFYEDFMKNPDVCRKTFKQEFFEQVFFSRVTNRKTKLKKLFIVKYPTVYNIICEMKGGLQSDNYNQFAIGLQRFEAFMVYDSVNLPMLKEGFGCFNIYDSIVSHDDNVLKEASKRLKEQFLKYGVTPTLNVEDFKEY